MEELLVELTSALEKMVIPKTAIMYNVDVYDIASNMRVGSGYIVYDASRRYQNRHDAQLLDLEGKELPTQAYKLIQIDEPVLVVIPWRTQ